jgi:hypothetical protein
MISLFLSIGLRSGNRFDAMDGSFIFAASSHGYSFWLHQQLRLSAVVGSDRGEVDSYETGSLSPV